MSSEVDADAKQNDVSSGTYVDLGDLDICIRSLACETVSLSTAVRSSTAHQYLWDVMTLLLMKYESGCPLRTLRKSLRFLWSRDHKGAQLGSDLGRKVCRG